MDEVNITQQFVALLNPLVPKGKLALTIIGEPTRKNEKDSLQDIIKIAKKYKLHRNKKKSLASITVNYNNGTNSLQGNHIVLKVDSLTSKDYKKRMIIISILLISVIILLLKK